MTMGEAIDENSKGDFVWGSGESTVCLNETNIVGKGNT